MPRKPKPPQKHQPRAGRANVDIVAKDMQAETTRVSQLNLKSIQLDPDDSLEFRAVGTHGKVPAHVELALRVLSDVREETGAILSDAPPGPVEQARRSAARVLTLYLESWPVFVLKKRKAPKLAKRVLAAKRAA